MSIKIKNKVSKSKFRMRINHVHMTIASARKHWDIFDLPQQEVIRQLDQMEKEGKTLVPSDGCNNFNQKTGCQGHPM